MLVGPNQMEAMMANRTGDRVLNYLKKFLSQRQLSVFLALGAILIMWPALKTGLMADDLVQRAVETQT